MGSTNGYADGLDVSSRVLKRLSACLPSESYARCVECLAQEDYGTALVILSAERAEAEIELQSIQRNEPSRSLKDTWRHLRRYHVATNHATNIDKVAHDLLKHMRRTKRTDPIIYVLFDR